MSETTVRVSPVSLQAIVAAILSIPAIMQGGRSAPHAIYEVYRGIYKEVNEKGVYPD
jgi:hypothetical protein